MTSFAENTDSVGFFTNQRNEPHHEKKDNHEYSQGEKYAKHTREDRQLKIPKIRDKLYGSEAWDLKNLSRLSTVRYSACVLSHTCQIICDWTAQREYNLSISRNI